MASVAGVRRLRKSRFRTTVQGPDGHVGVSAFGRKAGRAISVCRGAPGAPHTSGWHPLRPQRYRRAVGPGRIEPPAILTPIFLEAPGQFGDSAADERIGVKNPSRAGLRGEEDVRTRIPSAPAPLRHRDPAPEAPSSRFSAARAALPYPTIPPTGLGGVRSSERRPASPPPSRKTSDLPPGIGISIGPPILISTKQQASKTTQQHNSTTRQQNGKTVRP